MLFWVEKIMNPKITGLFYCNFRIIRILENHLPFYEDKYKSRTFLVAQMVKKLPAVLEMRILFLDWEDALEKGMATC